MADDKGPKPPNGSSTKDFYLASFPKSGSTWVRFMVANYMKLLSASDLTINWSSILYLFPDLSHGGQMMPQNPWGVPSIPRVIKTHNNPAPFMKRVMVLVRHPLHTMMSRYRFMSERPGFPEKMTFGQFLEHNEWGIKKWSGYYKSWIDRWGSHVVKFMKYEDLLESPHSQMAHLIECIGLECYEGFLDIAIRQSSREEMRENENRFESDSVLSRCKTRFVGLESDEDRYGFKPATKDIDYIRNNTKAVRGKFGYKI